jgi:hypothetical protein
MIYRGFWIVCRTCLFPIRLPYLPGTSFRRNGPSASRTILLACPVCAHVRQYRGTEVKIIAFRIPDPFRQKRAVLYTVEVPCGIPRCDGTARIYAVAATTVSVAWLLELWKHWVIHARCQGHSFKPLPRRTWVVCGAAQFGGSGISTSILPRHFTGPGSSWHFRL